MTATDEIAAAFELLLEEVESLAGALQEEGAEALRTGQLDRARALPEDVEKIVAFREKIRALQREWRQGTVARRSLSTTGRRRRGARLPRGLRTPEEAFRLPILESLVELGGRASAGEVLDRVEAKVSHLLNDHDRALLRSGQVRWRNTAMWCRQDLVNEGLLSRDSSHGVWEITEAGRRWLEENAGGGPGGNA